MSRTNDRTYQRNRRRCKRNSDTCHICGQWINPELTWPDPMSWSADHIHPIAKGGHNRGELKAAHLRCNQTRGAGRPQEPAHGRQW